MPSENAWDFVVDRSDLRRCEFAPATVPGSDELRADQVVLRVDRFALTANNITYAVFGEAMSYWDFFPTREGWGRVPVWGFGDVIRSTCEGVVEGERFYGYFPISTHLVVQAEGVGDAGFADGAPHRKALSPVYNNYLRTSFEPSYEKRTEDAHMLFRPLFTTAFLLDDSFAEQDFFGARSVLLSSASSKTSLALAYLLHRNRRDACRVVGLTSPGHVAFVEGLGCYDQVVPYDGVASLPRESAALVDMAGNGSVTSAIHHHFADDLVHSCRVGATHWEATGGGESLPGPQPSFFFAPAQAQKRMGEWGAAGLQERIDQAWGGFLADTAGWIRVVHGSGRAAIEAVYRDTLEGRARPDEGHVLSPEAS